MSVPAALGKTLLPDLSLSGSRVVMADPLTFYKHTDIRRPSIDSIDHPSPRESLTKEIHTCSTVNPNLFPKAAQHRFNATQGSAGSIKSILKEHTVYHKDVSTLHRVHLRNMPNGIAPLRESPIHSKKDLDLSGADEAELIRKALHLDRFKTLSSRSLLERNVEGNSAHSDNSQIKDQYFLKHDNIGRDSIRSDLNSLGCIKQTIHTENTPKTPPSQNSYRSLPTPLHASDNSPIPPNGAIIRTDSTAIESISSDKSRESSALSGSKRSDEHVTDEVNATNEQGRTFNKTGSAKSQRKKKKKKRQGSKNASKVARIKSGLGRIPAATPYESSPLQAFCKPMVVLTNKPEKPRQKYSPAQSGGWAPNVSTGTPYVSSNRSVNPISSMTQDLRMSPRKSLDNGALRRSLNVNSRHFDSTTMQKLIKVFLSEKQSGVLKELGMEFPCAPPATPTPAVLERFEYVPSMNDCRAQRAFKVRLEAMERVEKKKVEKIREEKLKQEKIQEKERERAWKKRQRLEIYALNKMMTELENANFQDFCRKNGLNSNA